MNFDNILSYIIDDIVYKDIIEIIFTKTIKKYHPKILRIRVHYKKSYIKLNEINKKYQNENKIPLHRILKPMPMKKN